MNSKPVPLIRNEAAAKAFLTRTGILMSKKTCRICGSTQVKPTGRGRSRCTSCGFTWGVRHGSIIEGSSLTCVQFIRIVRCFADSVAPQETALRANTDVATVEQMYRRIRLNILDIPQECSETGESGTANDARIIPTDPGEESPVVFGIQVKHDTIMIVPAPQVVPDLFRELDIPRMIRGNILLIDASEKNFHGLIAYLPGRTSQETIVYRPKNRTSWPPLTVFWRFAEILWSRNRHIDRAEIPGFVQELAFRYNHRNADMFHVVLEGLSGRRTLPGGYGSDGQTARPAGTAESSSPA